MIKNKWIAGIVVALPGVMTVASAMGKFFAPEPVRQGMAAVHAESYLIQLGLLELSAGVLFLIPATRNIGFFLACSYFGGAMAAHVVYGQPFTSPMVVLIVYWVALFLTRPGLFWTPLLR
ncbi:DoxX family protein [Fibrella aquatilis]|uniref:DoxX family protein n=1 Tax=Fibrella aquatilis TaxID=2817059 RepID=A0A939K0F9_9BACT|nr:DoxX family protein [Fibrella aquatilis]MBO0931961.1 DoxX family protein [Fibrella aquatilis]